MEGVAALVRQVALLPVAARAPGASGRGAVAHADLTQLLVYLEALQAELLHFLPERKKRETERKERKRGMLWTCHFV